ncbi:hypothetical protein HN51_039418 [Arachis hypogaea]|uniref:Kinetochore protein Nuf2 N-terminal domain-containing protein n=2 Tax=Arachis TaxID=3817 RepID=A0A444YJ80_ARAHY|nr:probable kinetochore protein nuf2 isoform X1 [Arachis ipaensis]XP_016205691.1 probable kinetochore protein nuf2 isoform X2 [Arachis ipaensis]XP_025663198.1 kinetochore protein NUF2 homolog isoform X1 [Arachis hypogaea]QHN84943.1 Kinetochore protein [Arachis hypogaea]RYR01929.1 hypothetical protein Ahy_B06g080793 [Arachis hypogaea]
MATSKYEYPTLSRPEIITTLAQLQIANMIEQDFIHPNPDLIFELYTRLLIHLDFLEEENEQLDFEAVSNFDDPELHMESIRATKLYYKIKEVLAILECPRRIVFTFADLLMPDTQRTEFFIGSIVNFVLYREGKLVEISKIGDEVSALEEQRINLEENEIPQVKSEISNLNEAREKEMAVVQEVDAKVAELRNTIMTLNKNQMSLRTTLKKSKDQAEEMDAKISNAEFTLSQNAQENENLRSKIAQSPDKIQRALEEKKLAREEAMKAERLAMQTFHEKTSLLEVYSKVGKKMSKHYKQMLAIKEQVNSAKSVEKELKALKAKLSDEQVLEKSLESKLAEKQSKVLQMEETKRQVEKECTIMQEKSIKYLNGITSDVEYKKRDIETRRRNVEAVLEEVDATNGKMKSVKESGAAKVELLGHKSEEIIEEFRKYVNSIARVVESGPEGVGVDI